MRKIFATSFILNLAAVLMNFGTGTMTARLLGADGRGVLASVQIIPNISAWVFGMGATQAVSYYFAKMESRRPEILTTWLVLLAPCAIVATLIDFSVVPALLASQSRHARYLAELWSPTVVVAIYSAVYSGALLGLHRYRLFSLLSIAPTIFVTTSYIACWAILGLTVESALLLLITGSLVGLGLNIYFVHSALQAGRPSRLIFKQTLPFGLKAHGNNFGQAFNARLDLLIMPSIVDSVVVGRYSVAGNLANIIAQVASAIGPIVLPVAARRRAGTPDPVYRAVAASLGVGLLLGVGGFIAAGWGVRRIYGPDFALAAESLRILIPGVVLFSAAQVFWSGLYALNRPLTALVSQVPGLLVTAVGLLLFLRRYGMIGASIVSTVSYTTVFFASWFFYQRSHNKSSTTLARPASDLVNAEPAVGIDLPRS